MLGKDTRRIYQLFAEILDYPSDSLPDSAVECFERLRSFSSDAAEKMGSFASFAKGESLASMEELYTRTFDITPTTTLYAGYHLFGESYKRGALLVRLHEAFRSHGFRCGSELADHLSVLLRFASDVDDAEFVNPLLGEGILPALEKMEEAFQKSEGGYGLVIGSLKSFLQQTCQELTVAGGVHHD